jgi:hypothetical protein
MNNTREQNAGEVFWKYGACSHAMFRLLDHEFENPRITEEQASSILARGIAQKVISAECFGVVP